MPTQYKSTLNLRRDTMVLPTSKRRPAKIEIMFNAYIGLGYCCEAGEVLTGEIAELEIAPDQEMSDGRKFNGAYREAVGTEAFLPDFEGHTLWTLRKYLGSVVGEVDPKSGLCPIYLKPFEVWRELPSTDVNPPLLTT